jgi:hypothetical protein
MMGDRIDGPVRLEDDLQEAVRAIPVPAMDDGFLERLEACLDAETREREREADEAATRRSARRRVVRGAALLGAAAALAAAVLVGVTSLRGGTEAASAAEVLERMRTALSHADNVQMRVTWTGEDVEDMGSYRTIRSSTDVTDYSATSAGDFRYEMEMRDTFGGDGARDTEGSTHVTVVYDAGRNESVMHRTGTGDVYEDSGGEMEQWTRTPNFWSGIGAAPAATALDWTAPYMGQVLAALSDSEPHFAVADTEYDGRAAWRLTIHDSYNEPFQGSYEGDTVLIVDRETGFLVHGELSTGGGVYRSTSTFDVTDLRINEPLPEGEYSTTRVDGLAVPPGAKIADGLPEDVDPATYDGRCEPDAVAGRVGFAPLQPQTVPAGYGLWQAGTGWVRAAVLPEARPEWFAGGETVVLDPEYSGAMVDLTKVPQDQAGFVYRRGLDTFAIQQARIGGRSGLSEDRLVRRAESGRAVERTALTGGAMAGSTAYTWIDAGGCSLLVCSGDLAVLVSGRLSRAEALAVAGSLEPQSGEH